jgi:hypothetical protein
MNSIYSTDQIAHWIKANYPNLRKDPFVIAQQYQTAIVNEIISNYTIRDEMDKKYNLYPISTHKLTHACGYHGARGQKKQFWWHILHKVFPYVTVVTKGVKDNGLNKPGTLTKVKVNFKMDWDREYNKNIHKLAAADPDSYDFVAIDLESLRAFITKTTEADYRDQANKIYSIAVDDSEGSQGVLPMLKRPADSGRMYYGGVNLQNCASVVRHAALGHHHSYDLSTSVYAWQIYMLRAIYNLDRYGKPPGTICTRELVTDKLAVRKRLVDTLKPMSGSYDFKLKLIKNALTAIGFGARSSNAYYDGEGRLQTGGIAGIIMNEAARNSFLKDPWVVEFLQEQKAISQLICKEVLELRPDYKTNPAVATNGYVSPKRLMAFLYQEYESRLMRKIMKHCEQHQVLLWVHDSFCTRSPINIADVNKMLELDYGDGIRLEPDHRNSWADNTVDEQAERAERIRAETEHWAKAGADTRDWHTNNVVQFRPQRQQAGHYNDGVSDYDGGRDPYTNSNRGLLNEQQFIERIYGKR